MTPSTFSTTWSSTSATAPSIWLNATGPKVKPRLAAQALALARYLHQVGVDLLAELGPNAPPGDFGQHLTAFKLRLDQFDP